MGGDGRVPRRVVSGGVARLAADGAFIPRGLEAAGTVGVVRGIFIARCVGGDGRIPYRLVSVSVHRPAADGAFIPRSLEAAGAVKIGRRIFTAQRMGGNRGERLRIVSGCVARLAADGAFIPRGLEAAGTVGIGGVVERAAGGMAVVTGRCGHGADRQQADQQGKEKRSPFLHDGIPLLCDLCRKTSAPG